LQLAGLVFMLFEVAVYQLLDTAYETVVQRMERHLYGEALGELIPEVGKQLDGLDLKPPVSGLAETFLYDAPQLDEVTLMEVPFHLDVILAEEGDFIGIGIVFEYHDAKRLSVFGDPVA